MDVISVSAALQIAGRAGRYGTAWTTVMIFQTFFYYTNIICD